MGGGVFNCSKTKTTQIASAYILHNTDAFFLFLPQQNFDTFFSSFLPFVFFLSRKNFDIFHVLLFRAFLCVFDNIYLPFLYIEQKLYKIFFYKLQKIKFKI